VIRKFCIVIIIILVLTGCRGCRENNSIVPLVAVDFTININEATFFELTNITGWVYVLGGSNGILIYRNNIDQFTAFDRHVPFEVDEFCQADVLEDNLTVKDECSESSWLILDGTILSGPTTQPLKQYSTSFNGSLLRVFN